MQFLCETSKKKQKKYLSFQNFECIKESKLKKNLKYEKKSIEYFPTPAHF